MSLANGFPSRTDAIVIGGGHNGLVAAAYLAGAGKKVVVLERRDVLGGACVTEEVVPGFRFSRAAYVNSLFRPGIIRELALERHGFAMIPRSPSSFTPLLDGRSLLLGPDAALQRQEISKFSPADAEALPRYEAMLDRVVRVLEPLLDRPPPDLGRRGLGRLAVLSELGRTGLRALRLGTELPMAIEILTAPAEKVLRRWFRSEPLLGTLATDAIIGAMVSPTSQGSAYVLLHHVMGETNGARGVWGYVKGGMGSLSEAIAAAARERGVRICTNAPVTSLIVEGGRASGVVLSNGQELRAKVVLSTADPHITFLQLTPRDALPDDFLRAMEQLDFTSPVTKINLALDRLPSFSAMAGSEAGPQHRGTIHLASSLEEIEAAYRDALGGVPSRRPVIEMTLPSALDPSLAPPGRHVASLFVQYTPYRLAEGSWDDPGTRERFLARVLDVVEEHAPGFKSSVLAHDLLAPPDLERVYALTGGNIFHGAMRPDQLFWLRPAAGWARHRTPLAGLYLCGAGAHPGGGVLGAPGRNGALVALRDLG